MKHHYNHLILDAGLSDRFTVWIFIGLFKPALSSVKPSTAAQKLGSKSRYSQPISKATEFGCFSFLNLKARCSLWALFLRLLPLAVWSHSFHDRCLFSWCLRLLPSHTGTRKGPWPQCDTDKYVTKISLKPNHNRNGNMILFSAQASAKAAKALIFAYLLQASVHFKNKPGVSEFTLLIKAITNAALQKLLRIRPLCNSCVRHTRLHLLRLTLTNNNTVIWPSLIITLMHTLKMKQHSLNVFNDFSLCRGFYPPVTIALCRNMTFYGIELHEMCHSCFHVIHHAPAHALFSITLLNASGRRSSMAHRWVICSVTAFVLCSPSHCSRASRCTCLHLSQTHKRTERHMRGGVISHFVHSLTVLLTP